MEHDHPLIVGVDPSSTCTGVAVLRGGKIVEMAQLRAKSAQSSVGRIAVMTMKLVKFLREYRSAWLAIEVTSGKVAGRLGNRVAGLGVYGMAVGAALWAAQDVLGPEAIVPVTENVWTRGVPKGRRQVGVGVMFPEYARGVGRHDAGGDVADAIGLTLWLSDLFALEARGGQVVYNLTLAAAVAEK